MEDYKDTYLTIKEPVESLGRERGSKFLSFAYPVTTPEEADARVDALRKKYHDATHHCFAWRMGFKGDMARQYDDGEPPSTAGRPILGQILSAGLTDILIVVVRYFGGTKLGVPGLIAAYRDAALSVIEAAEVVEKVKSRRLRIQFTYGEMNAVMRVLKNYSPDVVEQSFDLDCYMVVDIREALADAFVSQFEHLNDVKKTKITIKTLSSDE
ncbi:MAG: YigZ family protein [Rikenellaceae bacterium]|nr:YigZ family protein [Rikenellaceae bacterium]